MNPETFYSQLRQNAKPVVVDFWAAWCMPCRAMEPVLKQAEAEYQGKVDVWRINADESAALLQGLRIYGIPTLLVFRDGQEILRRTGSQSRAELNRLFEAAITGEVPAGKGLSPTERSLRLLVGLGLIIAGWLAGPAWVLMLVGGLVMFSGVYDRCPIWKAVAPRVAKLLGLVE